MVVWHSIAKFTAMHFEVYEMFYSFYIYITLYMNLSGVFAPVNITNHNAGESDLH